MNRNAQQTKRPQQQPKDNQPAFKIRSGALSVSIWEQKTDKGSFYTANPQRAFTRDDGASWEHSDSFGRDDLPVIASLMLQAHMMIVRKESQESAPNR